ncbi:mediator complex subunit Med5-domain-containing protein [Mycena rosella]|uniref:Mediator of RNA polymerase II transcription subunit 5 n=1 Tax=Mycena rosella TaxID=1033263 RepID=A0AAD7M923_MYCRO|nr:mediator complex subunit Med5-domain-containing protein [Mycena rosella]
MSLDDLTRNSFQSGISPAKWVSLCKMFLAKQNTFDSPQATQRALSNSVLVLYRSFPGDPDLQEYLKIALQSGILSIAVFVSTLLQAARSSELHAPATLDMLSRVALDAHYSSGLPSMSAVLSYSDSPMTLSNTLQDALALLRVAHELPMSHFHQLTTSASELVILLFSCADMSQVPPSQSMVILGDAGQMINHNSISQEVRQVLESFVLSLGLLMGDDAKVAPEAHLMHSFQLALGKSDILGSNSNTDTVSFSLTLSYLVAHRANEFGAGSGADPGALFVSMFRWSSWAPPVFYTQLLLSAFICLSESAAVSPLIWRAFIIGRLPSILISFEKILNSDSAAPENWRSALQVAVTSILRRSDLLERCDRLVNQAASAHSTHLEDMALSRILSRDFLRQLLLSGLLDQTFVLAMDPTFSNDTTLYLQSEAQDVGLDLDAYLYSKLSPDMDFDDTCLWIDRIWNDSGSHKTFAEVALRRFKTSASSLDTETLSHMCRIFYLCDAALDMISLHSRVSDLIFQALLFLEESDCETVGDPQTAVSHLGDVVLFVQSTLTRFHLETDVFTSGGRSISSGFLRSTAVVHRLDELSEEDATAFNAWYKALFDSSSEGIEDTILRSTQPKTLLRISPSLFSHAIKDANIEEEVLNNGISYFTGPLLRWTLVGVVLALSHEIQLKGFLAPKHFSVLQTLLLSSDCPRPVLCLCGQGIIALIADKRSQNVAASVSVDAVSMHRVVAHALGIPGGAQSQPVSLGSQIPGQSQPRQAIRDAIAKARGSKAPVLDVERCIKTCGCEKFLRILWSELLTLASMGETDICTRIATFALTIPRPLNSPPLLAMFLNILLPGLISTIDNRQVAEQTVAIELLGSIVSSILTASLHLDLAFSEASRPVLGQPSISMSRRVAADLRFRAKKYSNASKMILQRLSSSQSFVANFPVFKADS